jgi:hypothetical protein
MSQRLELEYSQAPGPRPNPPDLLGKLLDFIQAEFPEAVDEVRDDAFWRLRNQRAHDVARIAEIKAGVVEKLGKLELDRQRLLTEREEKQRVADLGDAEAKQRHAFEVRAAKEASLEKLIAALRNLKELGVKLDVKLVKKVKTMISDLADA